MSRRAGFTLLELLVVVAILAIIAGGIIAAYDGLERQSAKGQATFNIAALDRAVRTFSVINGSQPNNMDSLTFSAAGDGTDSVALDILPATIKGKLGPYTLTTQGVTALNAAGITTARFVANSYPNTYPTTPPVSSIPNRIFDNPTRGYGLSVTLTAGVVVAAVEGIGQADFTSSTPSDSSRLRDIAGLDETRAHVVVAFGIGNNSTLVTDVGNPLAPGAPNGGLAEAPFYTDVAPAEYGRFLALYQLATDSNGNGTIEAGEFFARAKFIAILDTKGDWYDEEMAEYKGIKPF